MNQVRIVGGRWRGRKIPVTDAPGLRPTPDRVRETLFNWLESDIHGSRVVDAFAGTGVLGLEALSRGAQHALFIEQSAAVARPIEQSLNNFMDADGDKLCSEVRVGSAEAVLHDCADHSVDLVFLDPPYQAQLLLPALQWLPRILAKHHRVYFEHPKSETLIFPPGWRILKEKQAGAIRFGLLTFQTTD